MDSAQEQLKNRAFRNGALATFAGLLAGTLTANLNRHWVSPIDSVGNRIVSKVPHFVESFVISIFGTRDKQVLIFTIGIAVVVLGGFAGSLRFKGKIRASNLIVLGLTLVSMISALLESHANPATVAPSLVGGVLTLALFNWLDKGKRAVPPLNVAEDEVTPDTVADPTKRKFLQLVAGVAAIGAATYLTGNSVRSKTINQIKKLALKLPRAAKPLPAPPADPANSIQGLSKLFTPNESFYRIDTAFNVPIIDSSTWKLKINGMVKHPMTLTYEDLLKRPLFELDDTLSCVSNPVGGSLISNARWLGVRLDDIINEAGPTSGADQVLSSSDDGFSAGFPLSVLDGRDAMIAVGMNGEVLPFKHGYPARLVVPGLYGYVSATKWVTQIELTRFDLKQGFWISRGWSVLAPIKIESRIDTPQFGAPVGKNTIAGVAWAPNDGVAAVQVQVDGGKWTNATLGPVLAKTTWRQWWLDWDATKGSHTITVRAISARGEVQPQTPADVAPNGAQGWHTVTINV